MTGKLLSAEALHEIRTFVETSVRDVRTAALVRTAERLLSHADALAESLREAERERDAARERSAKDQQSIRYTMECLAADDSPFVNAARHRADVAEAESKALRAQLEEAERRNEEINYLYHRTLGQLKGAERNLELTQSALSDASGVAEENKILRAQLEEAQAGAAAKKAEELHFNICGECKARIYRDDPTPVCATCSRLADEAAEARAEDWKREAESGQEAANCNHSLRLEAEAKVKELQAELKDAEREIQTQSKWKSEAMAENTRLRERVEALEKVLGTVGGEEHRAKINLRMVRDALEALVTGLPDGEYSGLGDARFALRETAGSALSETPGPAQESKSELMCGLSRGLFCDGNHPHPDPTRDWAAYADELKRANSHWGLTCTCTHLQAVGCPIHSPPKPAPASFTREEVEQAILSAHRHVSRFAVGNPSSEWFDMFRGALYRKGPDGR